MLRKFINLIIIIFVFVSCTTEIDNYNIPNGCIYGKLTDKITGENFQTEQPNGFVIKLFEKGSSIQSPIIFFGKPDGTFMNAWIFQNEYKVLPTEGAFFAVDTATVKVGAHTEINFEVLPFLAVTNININVLANKIVTNYQITRQQEIGKILECKTLVARFPTLNNVIYDFKSENNLSTTEDRAILSTIFSDEIEGLTSGTTYYVKIAVLADNPLKKYNYSKTYEITMP